MAYAVAKHEVEVGQIWQDTDKRRCERFVLVLEVVADADSPIPIDARVQSCDDKGACMIDCPKTIVSLNRLRSRFRLVYKANNTPVHHSAVEGSSL